VKFRDYKISSGPIQIGQIRINTYYKTISKDRDIRVLVMHKDSDRNYSNTPCWAVKYIDKPKNPCYPDGPNGTKYFSESWFKNIQPNEI
jgi:hypothetical protein